MSTVLPPTDLDAFTSHLQSSRRILALLGAGLSASSGLPTFRGAGGFWRTHDATQLASPRAFANNPGLVWQFYSYRRHMALRARPNRAHYALAQLARQEKGFLTISQNVDGLSPRAHHPPAQLELLHGSLFDIKCTSCDYWESGNFADPIVPALDIPEDPNSANGEADISNAEVPLRDIPRSELPHCSQCKYALLRPAVVWFGETLPRQTMSIVESWMHAPEKIDLMLVIGTSALVYPAAGYIAKARNKGARIAVINMEEPDQMSNRLTDDDWFFQGDAGEILPRILEPVIGANLEA